VTPEQRVQLELYFVQIRDLLRLNQWDIWISDEPAGEGSSLEIYPDERRWFARVKVGSFFNHHPADDLEMTRADQRSTVVHECLHLVHAHLMWWMEHGGWKTFEDALSAVDRHTIQEEYMNGVEMVVDFAAREIAKSMPMPPEWVDWPPKVE
jgi:hypothetical protein